MDFPIRSYRAPKWALPAGIAAIVVISFAIMLELSVRELRKETATRATPMAKAMVGKQITLMPGTPAPLTAVPHVATTPWPPTRLPSTALRTETGEKSGREKARTRLTRAEVAAKRSRETYPAYPAPQGSSRQ